ncbi:MAG: hypothetical protein Tsb009_17670 [Planctomycetaceae bacterium]
MSRNMICIGSFLGALLTLSMPQSLFAQWVGAANPCVCAQPVVQSCYQTVPVTEYRNVQRTVTQPVYETKYVDQKVTAYRPVTETRTATIPTVSYQTVTECKTVMQNRGYWRTRYEHLRLKSPCEYDPRPNLFGWLNRTGYSLRSMFTPRTVARREYVPNTVAYQVPVTRQVAVRGTRQVTYQVTRMQPYTTTRKVAVNTVRYVSRKVVQRHPVTVWRTVPIGSTIAYSTPYGTATALAPTPDPIGTAKRNTPNRTANSQDSKFNRAGTSQPEKKFERKSSEGESGKKIDFGIRGSSYQPARKTGSKKFVAVSRRAPSIVRAGRWMTTRRRIVQSQTGPALPAPNTLASISAR